MKTLIVAAILNFLPTIVLIDSDNQVYTSKLVFTSKKQYEIIPYSPILEVFNDSVGFGGHFEYFIHFGRN